MRHLLRASPAMGVAPDLDLPGRAPSRSRLMPEQKPEKTTLPGKALAWPAIAFIITLFLPWLWTVGSLIVSPFRVVLLITTVPCLWIWLSGKAGGIRAADIAIMLYCLWCIVSLAVIQGVGSGIQTGGVMFVETAGSYLLGRCFVRSPRQFHAMTRLLFWIIAALLPFAIMEAVRNSNDLMIFFAKFSRTHVISEAEPRWGLRRVQSVFEHPILFGVSTGAILALVHLVLGDRRPFAQRWALSGAVLLTAFLSLSSGPLSALVVQVGLLSWNWALRDNEMRWRLMWALVAAMWVAISLVSNQTVPEFLLTHFSFDQASAYYRVLIWHFGSMSVMNHPLYGVGFGSWDRPDWMPASIDMFWLYHAILFGLPAGIFMMSSFLLTVFSVGFRKIVDPGLERYRVAFLIVMTSYFLAGWTVHFWNATYVLFLFLMGSGAWLVDSRPERDSGPVDPPRPADPNAMSQRPANRQALPRTRQPSTRPSRQGSGSPQ